MKPLIFAFLVLLISGSIAYGQAPQQKSPSQAALDVIVVITTLSNYADQEAALIKQLQDENKALKEKLEAKEKAKE